MEINYNLFFSLTGALVEVPNSSKVRTRGIKRMSNLLSSLLTLSMFSCAFIKKILILLFVLQVFAEDPFNVHIKRQKQIDIAEPSGITYCSSTETVWIICDSCHSIYEMSTHGNLINEWRYNRTHKDTEAVTCDDENQIIHIALERYMEVITFILPHENDTSSYTIDEHGRYELIEINQFRVDIDVSY